MNDFAPSSEVSFDDLLKEAKDLGLYVEKPKKPHLSAPRAVPPPTRRLLRLRPQYEDEAIALVCERARCTNCDSEWMIPRNTVLYGVDKATGAARGLAVEVAEGWQNVRRTLVFHDTKVTCCPSCFHPDDEAPLPVDIFEKVKLNGDEYHHIYHWQEPFDTPPAREEWTPPTPPIDESVLDDLDFTTPFSEDSE